MDASSDDGAIAIDSDGLELGTEEEAKQQQQQPRRPPEPTLQPTPPQPLSLQDVVDDFSLQSQGIRFRAGREMRIYDQPHGQLILEERSAIDDDEEDGEGEEETHTLKDGAERSGDNEKGRRGRGIIVKTVNDKSYAFGFLRAIYSLMATFVGGFLFILGTCVLLFLFIDLATQLGVTSQGGLKVVDVIAVLLSIPVFIYSLAMGMTLVGAFVVDTFYGHPFLTSFGMGVATTDWIAFVLYIGIPSLSFIVTLFSKMDNWWEISLMVWFSSILIFWCLFSACVLCLEVWTCLKLMEEDGGTSLIDEDPCSARIKYWFKKSLNACVRTTRYRLSGTHVYYKKMEGDMPRIVNKTCINYISQDLIAENPYSYFANKKWNPCFIQKEPEQIHTSYDVLGRTSYVTRYSWNLVNLFCRTGGIQSTITITNGEPSITEAQINSTIACSILGNVIIVLLFSSFIVWYGVPPAGLVIVTIVALIFFIWVGFGTYRLFVLRGDIVNNENTTKYRFRELYQLSTPKDGFIRVAVVSMVLFLYILPLAYLCVANPPAASLFAFLGLFSGLRHFLNPRVLLLESDKKDYFQKNVIDVKTNQGRKEWKMKALLYHLVAVGGDTARHFWTVTFILFVVFFFIVAIWAAKDDDQNNIHAGSNSTVALVDGYTYQPQPHLPYPACRLKKGFVYDMELADFAFLSKLAYATDDKIAALLDSWFGPDAATHNVLLEEEFKISDYYENFDFGTGVSYKLITFRDYEGCILTIRGTLTIWDLIADAQLWLPTMIFQGLRFVLPFSELWTPILHYMVLIVSQLESENLRKVSFYRETTAFVNYLKVEEGLKVVMTGHSLGGGLAIITAAQSNTNAVAISGPNAIISRDSFVPPITVESLDTYTFNVVPRRDIIPKFDDKAMLYQNIECRAAANDIFGCHDVARSICEIQYTCGSLDRPVLCECFMDFGYPEPEVANTDTTNTAETQKTFVQSCIDICKEAGGSSEKCAQWRERKETNK